MGGMQGPPPPPPLGSLIAALEVWDHGTAAHTAESSARPPLDASSEVDICDVAAADTSSICVCDDTEIWIRSRTADAPDVWAAAIYGDARLRVFCALWRTGIYGSLSAGPRLEVITYQSSSNNCLVRTRGIGFNFVKGFMISPRPLLTQPYFPCINPV